MFRQAPDETGRQPLGCRPLRRPRSVPLNEGDFLSGDFPHGVQQHLVQDTCRPVVVAVWRNERLDDAPVQRFRRHQKAVDFSL